MGSSTFMRAFCDGVCIGSHFFRIAFNRSDGSDDKTAEPPANDFADQVLGLVLS
jgi:hypothetical protein